MKVTSEERATGMGATRFTAVLIDKKFVRVSDLKNVRYHGKNCGIYSYSVEVPDDTITAYFYRSNRGNEYVKVSTGQEFFSFEDAREFAKTK
jgi:hypothetical protein